MSMEDLGGSYFYGPHENEQWLRDVEKEFAFKEDVLLRRELKRIQRSAKKYSIDKYYQYYFSVTHDSGHTLFNPVINRTDGAVCVAETHRGETVVCLLRGSLLCSEPVSTLNEDDLDYASFLLGATNSVTKPEFYSRNGKTYYAEFGAFYEKGYLAFQRCWSRELWEEHCEQVGGLKEHPKTFSIYLKNGDEHEFVIDSALTIVPERVKYLHLQDENGNKVYA
jgi:hypothetical protein